MLLLRFTFNISWNIFKFHLAYNSNIMKNIYSNILSFNKHCLLKIVKLLKKDTLVALPTETVYGLAGNAYSNSAIKKFIIKKET